MREGCCNAFAEMLQEGKSITLKAITTLKILGMAADLQLSNLELALLYLCVAVRGIYCQHSRL
jgi:hypothetical protein